MFWLKKLIGYWLMPLPLCFALIAVGGLLLWATRRRRLGRGLLVTGLGLLGLFSNRAVSTALIAPLETRHPAMPELRAGEPLPARLAACRFVVVLGGGQNDLLALPATTQLSASALPRLVEAVRLSRVVPEARLIVSGPAYGPDWPTHASVLARAAEALGVAPTRIRQIDIARDTEDEAAAVLALVGDAPVALVTSAWHMPRAAALFHKTGVNALPCPADYRRAGAAGGPWNAFTFDLGSLERSTWAVRERLGGLWVRLRGKV